MKDKINVAMSSDQYPLRYLADGIFGVNIVRTISDALGAPWPILMMFDKVTSTDLQEAIKCSCCAMPMKRAAGLAVLRLLPGVELGGHPVQMIPVPICAECLKEPDSNKITPRVIKTLTGADKEAKSWKDMLN